MVYQMSGTPNTGRGISEASSPYSFTKEVAAEKKSKKSRK